jgi:tRNA1(Val) A37 N6-methylase TrmN6
MGMLIRKETISEELGVSLATVNNWIKTRVIPSPDIQNYYSRASFIYIVNKLKNGTERLNSRANRSQQSKKEICYLGITEKSRKRLLDSLIDDFEKSNLSVDDGILALSLAMLRSNGLVEECRQSNNHTKIDILLSSWMAKSAFPEKVKKLYSDYEIKNFDDDILGAFYQSIQSISQKSTSGVFYTPKELLEGIKIPPDKTVLDPCCGSGSILLNILSKKHDPAKIYARDMDERALKICFINLALFFNDKNPAINTSKRDITANSAGDLFVLTKDRRFDYIVTNPPWGSKLTKKEKDNLVTLYPELETAEVFSISLYNSLRLLEKHGELFFFLPHAFLNVGAHRNIRKHVFNEKNKIIIKLLGNAFKGVLSESVLLNIKKSSDEHTIVVQNRAGDIYQLPIKNIAPPDYMVSATSNSRDAGIMDKIYNTRHVTLENDAVFALGIVTGNNKKYLLAKTTKKSEAVFRGKDIKKYQFLDPEYFIEFRPALYQQTAPVEYYRQKKIVYRFICDKLVCVLDTSNTLILNSANFFIPRSYPMETVTAFFNSDIYTFIFRKKFYSKKVLRSHLQNLPLPVLDPDLHRYIYDLYNKLFNHGRGVVEDFQAEIDKIICDYFSISRSQYAYIKEEQ